MRILWVGDAMVSTGFARCTHAVCDALHAKGHELAILGINYFGDPHDRPYPIFPCISMTSGGRDVFGIGRLPRLVEQFSPEVVVILNDSWNIPAYLDAVEQNKNIKKKPMFVGWVAVDSVNQNGAALNGLRRLVVWTDWAGRELQRGGYSGDYGVVPLGVDGEVFFPRDRLESRRIAVPSIIPREAFIVGVVGRNQPRKRLDLTLEYFADWITRFDSSAYLYLHVAPTGEQGANLVSLIRYHNLQKRVILAQPDIGQGVPSEQLASVYSSFDVYWSTSQGEGWGLPALEAMACGVPCVVPRSSGLADWVGDAALTVPCTSTALSAPLNSAPYTIGSVVDRVASVEALEAMYRSEATRAAYNRSGIGLASELTWEKTGQAFVRELESSVGLRAVA